MRPDNSTIVGCWRKTATGGGRKCPNNQQSSARQLITTYYGINGVRVPLATVAAHYDVGTLAGSAKVTAIHSKRQARYWEQSHNYEERPPSSSSSSSSSSHSSSPPTYTQTTGIPSMHTAFDEFDPRLTGSNEMPALERAFQSDRLFSSGKKEKERRVRQEKRAERKAERKAKKQEEKQAKKRVEALVRERKEEKERSKPVKKSTKHRAEADLDGDCSRRLSNRVHTLVRRVLGRKSGPNY
ncbi:hypothetical protein ONZ45_g16957 [Pleurotus djamor]|nr:hypothetical protein ONZ45_g16957 [Pleurotus djamor]